MISQGDAGAGYSVRHRLNNVYLSRGLRLLDVWVKRAGCHYLQPS